MSFHFCVNYLFAECIVNFCVVIGTLKCSFGKLGWGAYEIPPMLLD